MGREQTVTTTITLKGEEISVKSCRLKQCELLFYSENPRIYSLCNSEPGDFSQAEIETSLKGMDHVKKLAQSIRANGGLLDPLIVLEDSNVVLEGNSRLAAYRILAAEDPAKWGAVRCQLLPRDITEDHIFALLGEYHIIGRQDWAPYEQAGYLYRRQTKHKIQAEQMAREMGLSSSKVKHLIRVYDFMVEHDDRDPQHWSYYHEYLKSRVINRAREEYPELDTIIVDRVKRGEIDKAVDIREKVATVAEKGGKLLKKFVRNPNSLEDCYEQAEEGGTNNALLKRLSKFREQICQREVKSSLLKLNEEQAKKCQFELKKIQSAVQNLLKALN